MKRLRCESLFLICSALIITGCGGGSSMGSSSGASPITSPNAQTSRVGQMSLTFSGKFLPKVDEGGDGVTITYGAGASFTDVVLFPNRTLANTKIAYFNEQSLFTISNGVSSDVTTLANGSLALYPSWTPSGALVFKAYDQPSNSFQVFDCLPDGSSFTKLTSSNHVGISAGRVSWAPNNSKFAYDDGTNLYTANTNGSGEAPFVSGGTNPAYSPDSTKIAYVAKNTAGMTQIYLLPATGSGTPALVSIGTTTVACGDPCWSPDGKWIAYDTTDSTNKVQQIFVQSTSLLTDTFYKIAQPASAFDSQPSFSPDSSEIAFMRASTYDGPAALTTSNYVGEQPIALTTATGAIAGPNWSPFPSAREYVGASGSMYTSAAAGFLWGQANNVFASLVSFTATTPAKAVITPQTSGSGPLVYTISADNLTGLKYTDAYIGLVTTVLPYSGVSATSAVVSFDATTGTIGTVAPFVASRLAITPKAIRQGSKLIYRGKFSGVWNGKGKNLAPNGATQLVIDGSKGKLVSFR